MAQVGRPRSFDEEEALEKAISAFWTYGYEATSMAILNQVMGLKKGSIYKAFGSKHELFMRALTQYLDAGYHNLQKTLANQPMPMEAIRSWLQAFLGGCSPDNGGRGCFALNSVTELAPHDPEVAALLQAHFARLERLLEATIAKAQARGELRDDETPEQLAQYIQVFTTGIITAAKGHLAFAQCQHMTELLLRTLTAR